MFSQDKLYHISEEGNIETFVPRPSPSVFEGLNSNVVFAISGKFLHNYLFPRNCPRVCYYAGSKTTSIDKKTFFDSPNIHFVLGYEQEWEKRITETQLYCYEFNTEGFELLDECAGYYIAYQTVTPISITPIKDPLQLLAKRKDIELRMLPTLWNLAEKVAKSSLNFSLIRMRNAKK